MVAEETHLLQQLLYDGNACLQLVAIVAIELDDLSHNIIVLLALHIIPIECIHLLLQPVAVKSEELLTDFTEKIYLLTYPMVCT